MEMLTCKWTKLKQKPNIKDKKSNIMQLFVMKNILKKNGRYAVNAPSFKYNIYGENG